MVSMVSMGSLLSLLQERLVEISLDVRQLLKMASGDMAQILVSDTDAVQDADSGVETLRH